MGGGHSKKRQRAAFVSSLLTDAWGKWYARYTRAIGMKDSKTVFHSFRHAMADALRAAEVSEEHADAILGHAGGGVGRSYGRGVPLKVLSESIAKVPYPGVQLPSHNE